MSILSRRRFLTSSAIAFTGVAAGANLPLRAAMGAASTATILRVDSRTIEVNGKPAKVLGLLQPDGTPGLSLKAGTRFQVHLENNGGEPTLIHWHGLLPPYGQDGVPDLPQPLLESGRAYDYDFPLETPGTHWMHAHTLQEQRLLAAPLIVSDPADVGRDEQEITVLFHDFSFKSPEELLSGLTRSQAAAGSMDHGNTPAAHDMPGVESMDTSGMPMDGMQMGMMPGMSHDGMGSMTMDLNDIEYDAYLANDRTLQDPQVHRVERGGVVRLRLINGATATAFWIDLGELTGDAVAVDGNPIVPVSGRRFPLGMAQRVDIRISIPKSEGTWPILALREGAVQRTGFILATKAGTIRGIDSTAAQPAPALDLQFESDLRALEPFPERGADQQSMMHLAGDMASYVWTINGRTWVQRQPLQVKRGQRVEVTLMNMSMMAHPMHLHGHHFQIVAIDSQRMSGAVRDVIWIPPMRSVTVAFDTANPGEWAFHCHHLYHMARGMMTTVKYVA
jgi:FtsP/CotA-like multicopper oxidase with cupredoxin domain